MPRVPRVTSQSVTERALPAPRVSPDNFGAPLARAAVAVGNQLASVVQEEREKVAEIQTNEALVRLRSARDAALYDPKEGVLTLQRGNALDAPERFTERWQRDVSGIAASIRDPEARRRFKMKAEQERVEAESMVLRHVDTETERLDADTTKLRAEALASDALALAGTAQADEKIVERESLVRGRLTRQGIVGDAQDAEVARQRSALRLAQIDALVKREQTDAAEALLDRVKDDLRGEDVDAAKTLVQESSLLTRSQQASDNLFAAFGPEDERAAIREAERQFTGEMRDKVVQRLAAAYGRERQFRAEALNERTTDALAVVESGRSLSASERAWFIENNPQALRSLDARARQVSNGTAVETSWPEYERLQAVFETGNLSAIRNLNISASRHLLSDTDYKAFIDRRSNILRGAADRENRALTPLAIDRQILIDLQEGEVVGKNVRTMGDLDEYPASNRVFTQTRLAVLQAIEAAQAAKTDGPLTGPEMMQAIRSVTDDLVVQRKWGGGRVIYPRAVAPEGVTEAAPRPERPVAPTATRPDLATRNAQLRAAGLSADQRLAVLQAEGYTDEDVPQATRP